jgi:hypothetical protein
MRQKSLSILIILMFGICFSSYAKDYKENSNKFDNAAVEAEAEVISDASVPDEESDPGILVEDAIEEYLNGPGRKLKEKADRKEIWIGQGTAEVNVGPENPNWAKHRVIAYEKALIDAENSYIKFQSQGIKAEKTREFFADAKLNVPDFKDEDVTNKGKFGRLIDKLLAVSEGKLDKSLDELGIDKEQYKKKSKAQKHQQLVDSINKSTMVESIGSLAGLIPVQTFEGQTSKGEHSIGIIVVASPKVRQLAHDILTRRGQFEPSSSKKRESLYDLFSKDKNTLIDQFGVRRIYDDEGYPCLVSFGQWGNSASTGNARMNRKFRAAAKKQAESQAKNAIAIFLTGTSIYSSNSDIGESFEKAVNVHSDNYKEDITVNEIMDVIKENTKSRAKVDISGLSNIYSWTLKHPQYGHEIVGVIIAWSPRDEQAARNLHDWKPNRDRTTKKKTQQKQYKGTTGVKQGKEYMDSDEF